MKYAQGWAAVALLSLSATAAADPAAVAHVLTVSAPVVSVSQAYVEVNRPVRVCDEAAPGTAPQPDHSTAGAIIGGLVGGLAGHQVGGGTGQTAATIAGAIGGGLLGEHIANGNNADAVPTEMCHMEDRYTREPQGYRVTYRYQGREYTDLLPRDPGNTVTLHVSVRAE